MGPVESAIRAATKPGTTLTTFGQSKPFVVEEFTPDAMVILLGSGQHRTRISWAALEGVIDQAGELVGRRRQASDPP